MFEFKPHQLHILRLLRDKSFITIDLETNSRDVETRMLAPTLEVAKQQLLKDLIFGRVYDTELVVDDCTPLIGNPNFVPPAKDFSKAKTGREQLEARLAQKNKARPSSLLSKLVSKK